MAAPERDVERGPPEDRLVDAVPLGEVGVERLRVPLLERRLRGDQVEQGGQAGGDDAHVLPHVAALVGGLPVRAAARAKRLAAVRAGDPDQPRRVAVVVPDHEDLRREEVAVRVGRPVDRRVLAAVQAEERGGRLLRAEVAAVVFEQERAVGLREFRAELFLEALEALRIDGALTGTLPERVSHGCRSWVSG
ncbi:MAG: hypothetical protein AVDCRST_MAG64-4230 [uncultured Phycisphaerae bacterium]|uniref:Uncharacterized protein n=1 Tax=uncultured Phycisphaerae bacterium TaxID=904963 RepID=A0A6J4QJL4_9BACT|nr:MAG: hypothetical protein AVDCRST_MAG64-4230 [uncultured Phycisphaerae bacterium]